MSDKKKEPDLNDIHLSNPEVIRQSIAADKARAQLQAQMRLAENPDSEETARPDNVVNIDDHRKHGYGRAFPDDIPPEHKDLILFKIVQPALDWITSDYGDEKKEKCTYVGYALGNAYGVDNPDARKIFLDWCTLQGELNSARAEQFWDDEIRPNRDGKGYGLAYIFNQAHDAGYLHPLRHFTHGYEYDDVTDTRIETKLKQETVRGTLYDDEKLTTICILKRYLPRYFESVKDTYRLIHCIPYKVFEPIVNRKFNELFADADAKPTAVNRLLELAKDAKLYKTSDEKSIITVLRDGVYENYRIKSGACERWLRMVCYDKYKQVPDSKTLSDVINTLDTKALFEGEIAKEFNTVGEHEGKNYIDMKNERRSVIEFSKDGWREIDNFNHPQIKFIRYPGMLPLPSPVRGADINELKKLINLKNNDKFVLVVSQLLAMMLKMKVYPILFAIGEAGTAKTSFATIIRNIIDCNTDKAGTPPKSETDYLVRFSERYVATVDNLSNITGDRSDMYCRVATGTTDASRQLHTNYDTARIHVVGPQILTSRHNPADRGDLRRRSYFVDLEFIPPKDRLDDDELENLFNELHPKILGALLDIIVVGLKELPNVQIPHDTKIDTGMSKCIKLAMACEKAYCKEGDFLRAYGGAQIATTENSLEGDAVFLALLKALTPNKHIKEKIADLREKILGKKGDEEQIEGWRKQLAKAKKQTGMEIHGGIEWEGTATDLLDLLNKHRPVERKVYWPISPKSLSDWFEKDGSVLRQLECKVIKKHMKQRLLYIFIPTKVFARFSGDEVTPNDSEPMDNV